MFVFTIKILLGISLIVLFAMMFVDIFRKKPNEDAKNKVAYVKEHRDTFGINDSDAVDDDFQNDEIIVLKPQQLYDENAGGTY